MLVLVVKKIYTPQGVDLKAYLARSYKGMTLGKLA